MYFFYLIEQNSKFLLHNLQVLYMCNFCDSTELFEITVGVLTACHTQYTSDSSICVFLFNYFYLIFRSVLDHPQRDIYFLYVSY